VAAVRAVSGSVVEEVAQRPSRDVVTGGRDPRPLQHRAAGSRDACCASSSTTEVRRLGRRGGRV